MGTQYKNVDALIRFVQGFQAKRFWRGYRRDYPRKHSNSVVDLHTHTNHSDATGLLEMLVRGLYSPLDGMAITDHNCTDGYKTLMDFLESPAYRRLMEVYPHNKVNPDGSLRFDLIPGTEVSAAGGVHIIGIGIEENIPKGLSEIETILAIQELGGRAIAAHPYAHFIGVEDYRGVNGKFCELPFDLVEVLNGSLFNAGVNEQALEKIINCKNPPGVCGGTDAHSVLMLGFAGTQYPGFGREALFRAIDEGTTEPYGHVWRPSELLHAWGEYLRLKKNIEKIPGMSDFLRSHSEMLGGKLNEMISPSEILEATLQFAWRQAKRGSRYIKLRRKGMPPKPDPNPQNLSKNGTGKGM